MVSRIPHINLLVLKDTFSTALVHALELYNIKDKMSYSIHETSLSQLSADIKSDLIVSPANSYGILDGGFDDAISRALSLTTDYSALIRHCQTVLYNRYRGYQPPGSCVVIELPPELLVEGATKNVWGTRYIGHCPTMRVPDAVLWDREVVYECTWALLCEIDRHNRGCGGEKVIRSMLMTPFATGCGKVSAERWARQTALALKHFLEALEKPQVWSAMEWNKVMDVDEEIKQTHLL